MKKIGLSSMIVTAAMMVGGISAHADTLVQALAATYLNNPTLQAQRANVRSVDENVPQALSGWRPVITGSASLSGQYNKSSTTKLTGDNTLIPNSIGVTVSQPLYEGGITDAATKSAEAQVGAARANLSSVEQSVLQSAVSAYMNVVRDQAVLSLNQSNVAVLQRQLEAANDRFEVGEITRTDVAQAQARLAGAVSDQVQAEGNLKSSRANYQRIVGEAPGKLEPPARPAAFPGSLNEAIEIGLANHPDIAAARQNERSSYHSIRATSGRLLPKLSLDGSLSHSDNTSTDASWSNSASIGATLTVPFYQSGAVYSQVRQARQVNSQRKIQIDEAVRAVREVVSQAWERLDTARARIKSSNEQIRANAIALDGVQQEAQVGSRTTLDVLDAEQELLVSNVNLVTSKRNEFVAIFDVLAAVGNLTAKNMNLPVALYDPEANFDRVRNKWRGLDGKLD